MTNQSGVVIWVRGKSGLEWSGRGGDDENAQFGIQWTGRPTRSHLGIG